MGGGIARGINLSVGLGLLGSAVAGVVTTGLGWPAAPFVTISALLGVLGGLSFIRAAMPARDAAPDLRRRLESTVEAACSNVGVDTPRAVVSTRATNASISICNGRAQLVVPSLWVETLPDAHLAACAMHEVAHIKQPGVWRLSRRAWSSTVASWNFGLGLAAFFYLFSPQGFTAHHSIYVVYALVPLVLTVAVDLRRLAHLRTLIALEYAADSQAVAWGIPADVMAATLSDLGAPALTVRLPWDQRLLVTLALYRIPRSLLAERTSRLRALAAAR